MGTADAHVVVTSPSGDVEEEVTIATGEVEFVVWNTSSGGSVDPGIVTDRLAHFIDSDQPLQAWQFSPPLAGADNDASILFPTHTLGTRHRVASYVGSSQSDEFGGSAETASAEQSLVIHAVEDGTEVTVTLTAERARGFMEGQALDVEGGSPSGTVTLNRGESIILGEDWVEAMPAQVDWTGTLVESTGPVSIYAASFTNIPVGITAAAPGSFCCGDTVGSLIPSTEVLGDKYVVTKTIPVGEEYDVFRVVADEDDTVVTFAGDVDEQITLAAGEFHEIHTTGSFVAQGNKAFVMVHYLPSSSLGFPDRSGFGDGGGIETSDCGFVDTPGDPGMSVMFPVDNWLDAYTFPSGAAGIGGGWCYDHATVTAPAAVWDEIRLSGEPLPTPVPIADGEFVFAYVELATDGAYALEAPDGTGVQLTVYGYQDDGSYLYPGGMRLDVLNPPG